MKVEDLVELINEALKTDRITQKIEGDTKFSFNEEILRTLNTSNNIPKGYIRYELKLLFNNKIVIQESYSTKEENYEKSKEGAKKVFMEYIIQLLVYSAGPFDWQSFVDGSYNGIFDQHDWYKAVDAKNYKYPITIYRKQGWTLNPNDKVVNNIIKRIQLNNGECPCHNDSIDKHCPCDSYRINDVCHCTLYIKKNS